MRDGQNYTLQNIAVHQTTLQSDRLRVWLLPGVVLSVLLHFSLAAHYLYQPMSEVVQPPAAIPVSVAFAAPLAAPRAEKLVPNIGPEQKEAVDSVASVAHPDTSHPTSEAPSSEQPISNKSQLERPLVTAAKSSHPSEIAAVKPTSRKTNQAVTDTSKASKQKQKVETQKQTTNASNQLNSAAQVETSAPQLDINKREQVQGVSGALSQHVQQLKLSWKQQLVVHLEQHKRYPRRAKRLRQQGSPLISFTMDRSGQVLGAKLVRSSGTEALDKEALDLVFRAMPLPTPPDEVTGATLTWTVPVRFYVR